MTSPEFTQLYTRQKQDESITPFSNEVGFSLVRKYAEGSMFEKEGMRMFIKLAVLPQGLFWSVNMTKPNTSEEQLTYSIIEDAKYTKKITNFYSDNEDTDFKFDLALNRVVHPLTGKVFTINEFIEILVSNHLSDRLSFKRKINIVVNLFLKLLFWLSDKHYEKVRTSIDLYEFRRSGQPSTPENQNIEPFFKYFLISRNLIFAALLFVLVVIVLIKLLPGAVLKTVITPIGDYSLSNPTLLLLIFVMLFVSEKLSIRLNNKIKEFFAKEDYNKKINFIEKLHNYHMNNRFKLKLKK